MRRIIQWDAVHRQLARLQAAGVVDRYSVRNNEVVLVQGRYAHKIPVKDISTFLAGMMHYARAAGVDKARHAA